jgi:hypothetical protein
MKEIRFTYGTQEYLTVAPTAAVLSEAKAAYTMAFRKAIEAGAYLRKSFDKILGDQGLWSEAKTKKISSLQFLLAKLERKLNSKIKLSEAKEVAKQLVEARNELRELVYERTALDDRTSEGQAEQARLEYICSVCTLDQITRKPAFSSVIDMNDSDQDLVSICLDKIAGLVYEVDPDFESKLPEQKFFTRFGKPDIEMTEEVKEFIEDIAQIETVGDVETIEYEDDITPVEQELEDVEVPTEVEAEVQV